MLNQLRARLTGRFSREDVIRLIASLVLATLLWGWVSLVTDPEVTRSFGPYTPDYEPLEGDLLLVGSIPDVVVRLTGPESVIEDVTIDEIAVSIDTSEIDEPNEYTLPIRVTAPDGVRKRQAVPTSVKIFVERTQTAIFPLEPEVVDQPQNDPRQVGQLVPEVTEVTVTGPQSAVERVTQVRLPIEIGDRTRDFEAEFTPIALDQAGRTVAEVAIAPDRVRVHVPISRRGRSVAVIPQVQGVPAIGFEEVARTSIPSSVQVNGPPEVLASSVTVLTQPLDITGATDTVTERVPLDLTSLPDGVEVVEPADGMVDVVVQIDQRGVNQALPDQEIVVVGLGQGLAASAEPETVAVTVVATQEQLEALEAGDIVVTVDVTGLEPGSHQLAPGVIVPANMRWVRTEPAVVTVTIEPVPETDGTPPASPEPSPPLPAGDQAPASSPGAVQSWSPSAFTAMSTSRRRPAHRRGRTRRRPCPCRG
jgi:YbbR domain-containing protein